jgi:hypothetical protein
MSQDVEKNLIIEKSFNKLIIHLDELTKGYRQLLDCVRKEKDLLILTDIEKLNENNLLKEQLLFKIKSMDALRVNYATELSMALGLDTQKMRLLEIAQKIGGPSADKLRTFHSTLELLIKRLTELNQSNAQFAESALKTVNSAMNSFKDTLMGQKTYQNKGKYKQGNDKSGHLVSKEA